MSASREDLHRALDALLDRRESTVPPTTDLRLLPHIMLRDTLLFARDVLGDQYVADAMKTAGDGEALLLLSHRLAMLRPMLSDPWPDGLSLDDITGEIYAIAGDDAPRIFARRGRKGSFNNGHRLKTHQLKALTWERRLAAAGMPDRDARLEVSKAYASAPWDTIRTWRKSCAAAFGEEEVAFQLKLAGLLSVFTDDGPPASIDQLLALLATDGEAYYAETLLTKNRGD